MTAFLQIGDPVFVPKGHLELGLLAGRCLAAFEPAILAAVKALVFQPGAEAFLRFEEDVLRLFMLAASHATAGAVAFLHEDPAWVGSAVEQARQRRPAPLRHRGQRLTAVRFLGGAVLSLETPYLSESREGQPGRARGVGRRGEAGGGLYPALHALGIAHQATPALYSEVARQAVRTASFEEAREALGERGIRLDGKTVRRLALHVGGQALAQRAARAQAAELGLVFTNELEGKRIVISTDGGRIRLREGGRRGRKGKSGRRRFSTPWREPKLIVVYVIDEKGRRDPTVPVIYDGTLGDADATFDLLVTELTLRGASKAKEIIMTADGARWIWDRADDLARSLGLAPESIVKVADFYHGVEHLSHLVEHCTSWPEEKRSAWVKRMRRRLKHGQVESIIKEARTLARGRNASKILTEVKYFESRREMMRYDEFRRRGIPQGSGAVESAIRRVVNLRLKGPSIFWRGPNAERMLHLRCYLKAGRWAELMLRVMHRSPTGLPTPGVLRDAA